MYMEEGTSLFQFRTRIAKLVVGGIINIGTWRLSVWQWGANFCKFWIDCGGLWLAYLISDGIQLTEIRHGTAIDRVDGWLALKKWAGNVLISFKLESKSHTRTSGVLFVLVDKFHQSLNL